MKKIKITAIASGILAIVVVCFASTVNAYQLLGYQWPQPSTTFYVDISGAENLWNNAFENAMYEWSNATVFQYYIVRQTYSDPCDSSDSRNGVRFDSTLCGDAWGGSTLAITSSRYIGTKILQTDIVFNSNDSWNVYSTSWSSWPWIGVNDFHRVAVHELGHALGLGHEDGIDSTIMGTFIGNNTIPLADDINGVAAIYGAVYCSHSISPSKGSFPAEGGIETVWISASSSSCAWTTNEAVSWVSLSPTDGVGNQYVTVTVTANTGSAARNASISIADQMYTISQNPAANPLLIPTIPFPMPLAAIMLLLLNPQDL